LSRGTGCTLRLVFGVQLVLFLGLAVAGVVRFVPRARCGLCLACSLCFLWASRWQGWFGLSRGMVYTLRLVIGVQLVLFVGVAVANVEVDMVAAVVRFVRRDSVQVAACVCRATGSVCRRGGGGRGAGRGGGGGGAVCPAGWLARSDASCVWGVVAALRVGTSRRTWHVTTTSG